MRALPSRYAVKFQPAVVKKTRAKLAHIEIPSKGLSFEARTNAVDAKFAGILTNFYVDDDRLTVRAGFEKVTTCVGEAPVDVLIPYYGAPEDLIAATNNTLCEIATGTVIKSGFGSNDWHWTSFSNLGAKEYTIMVNGHDGVIAWDGGAEPGGAVVNLSKIAGSGTGTPPPSNPAQCTVTTPADIANFHDGMTVVISGADANHILANGAHRITSVNNPPNTFSLVGVDLSGAGVDQITGAMTATLQGSFEKQGVLPPTGNTWLDPNDFHIVLAHQNRLWFADQTNLAVYYLPLMQKDGVLGVIPLNAIFKKGGSIKAMATWTVDGGMGMDDQLVIFSTNGETAIYTGFDPATNMELAGVYRADAPVSKHGTLNYGGELYVLLPTGVVPMTAMIKAGREGLESVEKTMLPYFLRHSIQHQNITLGWQLFLNPSSGRMFANLPMGQGVYHQAIRHMAKAVWSTFDGVPARFWGWVNPYVYFGDDVGNIYRMHPQFQSDDGKAIVVDVLMAWNQFKTPALKHFKMALAYIVTDGTPRPYLDVKVDYDQSLTINQPEPTTEAVEGSAWDVSDWDEADWAGGNRNWANWTGVGSLGRVGAVRMTAAVYNCTFAVLGWDILYDEGSVFG